MRTDKFALSRPIPKQHSKKLRQGGPAVAHRHHPLRRSPERFVDKIAIEGMRFQPGETLFRIVDTSVMWVLAEVYEQDLGYVQVG